MRAFTFILACSVSLACALGFGKPAFADEDTELVGARLEHKLAYLAADYAMAASSAAPSDEGESEEHVALAAELERTAVRLPLGPDHAKRVLAVGALVRRSAPASEVSAAVEEARRILVADLGLVVAPTAAPDAARGRAIFEQYCSGCHGATGRADTERARALKPHPANFLDPNVGEPLSPYRVSTTVRFGVDGTPMVPFGLDEHDRWDVAFYVMGLRHVAPPVEGPSVGLAELANRSDAELRSKLHAAGVGEARVEGVLTFLRQRTPYAAPAPRSRWTLARGAIAEVLAHATSTRASLAGVLGTLIVVCAVSWVRARRRVAIESAASSRFAHRAALSAAVFALVLICAAASTRAAAAPPASPAEMGRVFENVPFEGEHASAAGDPSATDPTRAAAARAIGPLAPCSSPGYGVGPEPRFAGGLPFSVIFNCLWPSHARMEISVALMRPATRAEVESLLRGLWSELHARMGKDFPETAKVCVLRKGATLADSPLGCIKDGYEPEGEPGEEEADLTVNVPSEPAEAAEALGRALKGRSAGAPTRVTYEKTRGEIAVAYAFSEETTDRGTSSPSFAEVALPLFVAAWNFYPPKTGVSALSFEATAGGHVLLRVRIANLGAFLAMQPWVLRQRLDEARVPIDLAAIRTNDEDATLGRELEGALAKLPPGSVVRSPR